VIRCHSARFWPLVIIFDDVFYQAILKVERWGEVSLVRKYLLPLVGSSLLPVHFADERRINECSSLHPFVNCVIVIFNVVQIMLVIHFFHITEQVLNVNFWNL